MLIKRNERQANELLAVSAALNDNTKVVVEYWADPTGSQTPPGHWSRVCEFISQRDNHTLDDVRAPGLAPRSVTVLCIGSRLALLHCMRTDSSGCLLWTARAPGCRKPSASVCGAQDAKMFFAVTGALLDASITSWAMKRVYTSVRPITAIHYLYADNAVRLARRGSSALR